MVLTIAWNHPAGRVRHPVFKGFEKTDILPFWGESKSSGDRQRDRNPYDPYSCLSNISPRDILDADTKNQYPWPDIEQVRKGKPVLHSYQLISTDSLAGTIFLTMVIFWQTLYIGLRTTTPSVGRWPRLDRLSYLPAGKTACFTFY